MRTRRNQSTPAADGLNSSAGRSAYIVALVLLVTGCGKPPAPATSDPAPAGAVLQAMPNPVPTGSNSTTITWDSGTKTTAQLYVSQDGGAEKLLSEDRKGSKQVEWIGTGSYEFRLYAGKDHTTRLASLVVTRGAAVQSSTERKQ